MARYRQCKWCGRTYEVEDEAADFFEASEYQGYCGEKCYLESQGLDPASQAKKAVAAMEEKMAKERKRQEQEHAELLATLEQERQAREEERALERKQREEERALERRQREEERIREEERREEERKRDPQRWYGNEWVAHLSKHPEDAFQCDWRKLKGSDCAALFSVQPDLAPTDIDWPSRLTGDDWEKLLSRQSRFLDQCSWGRLSAENWAKLLKKYPKVADKCTKWDKISVELWVELLEKRPQFAEKCNWAKLKQVPNGESPSAGLRRVLESNPDLVSECDLNVLIADDWAKLLIAQPQLVTKCDKWDEVSIECWIKLLRKHPQWAEKCNCSKIGSSGLCKILQRHPALSSSLDLAVLTPNDWASLLRTQPDLVAKFNNKWSEIDDDAWAQLILQQPRFIENCEKLMNFSGEAIERILLRYPELVERFELSKLSDASIANLLSQHPEFAEKVDLSILDDKDWNKLLSKQPQFADRYRSWSDDPIADIVKVVTKCPALAEAFDWERLGGEYRRRRVWCEESKSKIYYYPLYDKLREAGVSEQTFNKFVERMSIRTWLSLWTWNRDYAVDVDLTVEKIGAASNEELLHLLLNCFYGSRQDLAHNNYIEEIIDASRFSVDDWVELLVRAPDRCYEIILDKLKAKSVEFGPDQWAKVVNYYPECYEKHCKDLVFGPTQWGTALSRNYDNEDLMKFWDSKGYSIEDWTDFLVALDARGSARDRFNSMVDWDEMIKIPAEKWIRLVLTDEMYVKKLNWEKFKEDPDVWQKLTPNEWIVLILRWNGALKYFHHYTFNWQEVFAINWVCLLESFPQFKEKCDITKVDWSRLLIVSRDPMVRALCVCPDGIENYYKDWASLSHDQWKVLVKHKPALKSLMEKYDNRKNEEKSKSDKKNDGKQVSKNKKAGCQLGCLGALIKLVFWCAVIGFGLIFGWRLISRLIGS